MTTLIALSGLPGVGKTTLAKELSSRAKAIHLRVDSVEAALKRSVLRVHPAEDAGYLAIASIANDNLSLGFDVIADTVNPVEITRKLWADTANATSSKLVDVEVVCSDISIHRERIETRTSDIEQLAVPDWQAVITRTFEPWHTKRMIVDTAVLSINDCANKVLDALADW